MEDKSGIIRIERGEETLTGSTYIFYDGDGSFALGIDGNGTNISVWFTTAELVELKAAIETALEKSEK